MTGNENDLKMLYKRWEKDVDPLFEMDYWLWEWYQKREQFCLRKVEEWLYVAEGNGVVSSERARTIAGWLNELMETDDVERIEELVDAIADEIRYAIFAHARRIA